MIQAIQQVYTEKFELLTCIIEATRKTNAFAVRGALL